MKILLIILCGLLISGCWFAPPNGKSEISCTVISKYYHSDSTINCGFIIIAKDDDDQIYTVHTSYSVYEHTNINDKVKLYWDNIQYQLEITEVPKITEDINDNNK